MIAAFVTFPSNQGKWTNFQQKKKKEEKKKTAIYAKMFDFLIYKCLCISFWIFIKRTLD